MNIMNTLSLVRDLSGKIIIDGRLQKPKSTESFSIMNPATDDILGHAPLCGDVDIDNAVQLSKVAQKSWKRMLVQERGKLLRACGRALLEHKEELAILMTLETGKALRTESRVEIPIIVDTLDYYAGLGNELKGETIPFDPDMLTYTIYEPLGVVGAIIPWNVPLMLLAFKFAPALIAGNTIVIKPSPEATFTTLRTVQIMNELLPPNICNVVTGDGVLTGATLVQHPDIAKVSFTGSVESGRAVYKNAAEKIIPVTLELGGKSPLIIMEDADIDQCTNTALEGMRFTRQGQSCSAASRLFVHKKIYQAFFEVLKTKLSALKIGDPMDESTDIATLISKKQFDKIQSFTSMAENDPTVQIHYCGELSTAPHLQKGYFVRPAIITGITNDHSICQNEIFGPVVSMIEWEDFDEVVTAANDTRFGLAAGIYTNDLTKALHFVNIIEAGFVQVNQYKVVRPMLPFGGFKQSGIGKEACLETVKEHYMRKKTIMISMKS